ncbi:MAG: selenocysteine-specific translation elongation factor [Chloroflexi bacterium]|nr:selenocysteine-specific translation elongation factor [Chloroflexota bacterium]MCI0578605.1 selenocysteine-specific translation elongation factor [Chloroflexota bacterium]MCI0647364.1 selenocysteine-specific translation elongation factor [Chloroflexota bacterium]MCI0727824.1 selenocysteine-specific translation elongation factor [Chloroflexota bacterium]
MHVIGTAGHVDHGKSTLVKALTGIDPDRLKEEKEREMTIDLGFAWLRLDGEEVGIVDVPGHRDFIENMLAGVGGIDLALFVVAADEGVMPQTREHLAILDLLEVRGGVVALTKVDLVDDPDWLELVTLDVAEALAGTALADAPIVPVSARTGRGLAELQATLRERLAQVEPRPDDGRPRLPIDRVFSLSGFGTVVTGTLTGGQLRTGDAVEIQPAGLKGRVRGLQTHRTKLDAARPGSRVAVNVSGIDKDEVRRGDVLAGPGVVRGTLLCDALYRHLPDADSPLGHNVEVKLFAGAAEVVARTRILGARQIEPGQQGWLQLALSQPVAIVRGDRFILRRPSPPATLGGGQVLDPHPGRRHPRFRPEVTGRLETLAQGTPADLLLQTIRRLEPAMRADVLKRSGLTPEAAEAAWQELAGQGQVHALEQVVISRAGLQRLQEQLTGAIADFHRQYPLRLGMSREELRSRLKLPAAVFNPLLAQAAAGGLLVESGALVRLPDHAVRFTPTQQAAIDRLLRRFERAGVNSPSVKEARAEVGDDVYFALLDLGRLRPVSDDVVYTTEEYERIVEQMKGYLRRHGRVNAAQVRDLFNTSRKYAIALLEHLDEIRVTRRVGDDRELVE